MIEKHSVKVGTSQNGGRLDVALTELIPQLSRKKIKTIIDNGGAYVNKKRILFAKHIVKQGDVLEVFFEVRKDSSTETEKSSSALIEADILFENEGFLAVNKPAGVPSQATLTSSHGTILHEIEKLNPKKYSQKNLFLVHRLDKDTSGVLLVAKTADWRKFLEEAFRNHSIQKNYEAITFGIPKELSGKIEYAIAKNLQANNAYYAVLKPGGRHADQKSAVTEYRTLSSFKSTKSAHVACYPKTGRTHQIRVHLLALGCPILGDKTYAQNIIGHSLAQLALRQMLHAKAVEFKGPDKKSYRIEAPYPQDFHDCLAEINAIEIK